MLRLAVFVLVAASAFAQATDPTVLETSEVGFAVDASSATRVSVVGDFNGWDVSRTPLARDASGTWKVRTDLRKGKVYDYAFVVDGHWILDPKNPLKTGDGKLSVIEVPGASDDQVAGGGLADVRAMLKKMNERLSYYGDEVSQLRKELGATNDTIAKKEAQIDLLRKDLDDARSERVTLTKEVTEARIRLDEVSQRYTTLKSDTENHTDDSEKSAKRVADIQKQFSDMQSKMNSVLQEKRTAEERAQKAEDQAHDLEARFHALDAKYMALAKEGSAGGHDDEDAGHDGAEPPRDHDDPNWGPIHSKEGSDPKDGPAKKTDGPEPKGISAEKHGLGPEAHDLLPGKDDGRVLVVGETTRMVMISLGGKHGVKEGDEFFIRRGAKAIAKVKVLHVEDEFSRAEVQGDVKMSDIAADDPVVAAEK